MHQCCSILDWAKFGVTRHHNYFKISFPAIQHRKWTSSSFCVGQGNTFDSTFEFEYLFKLRLKVVDLLCWYMTPAKLFYLVLTNSCKEFAVHVLNYSFLEHTDLVCMCVYLLAGILLAFLLAKREIENQFTSRTQKISKQISPQKL